MMNKFGERLREIREERGYSQKDIGNIFGATQATISRWEQGIQYPDLDTIMKICKHFEVTSDYLLGLSDI